MWLQTVNKKTLNNTHSCFVHNIFVDVDQSVYGALSKRRSTVTAASIDNSSFSGHWNQGDTLTQSYPRMHLLSERFSLKWKRGVQEDAVSLWAVQTKARAQPGNVQSHPSVESVCISPTSLCSVSAHLNLSNKAFAVMTLFGLYSS